MTGDLDDVGPRLLGARPHGELHGCDSTDASPASASARRLSGAGRCACPRGRAPRRAPTSVSMRARRGPARRGPDPWSACRGSRPPRCRARSRRVGRRRRCSARSWRCATSDSTAATWLAVDAWACSRWASDAGDRAGERARARSRARRRRTARGTVCKALGHGAAADGGEHEPAAGDGVERGERRVPVGDVGDGHDVGVERGTRPGSPSATVATSAPTSSWLTRPDVVAVEHLDGVLDGDDVAARGVVFTWSTSAASVVVAPLPTGLATRTRPAVAAGERLGGHRGRPRSSSGGSSSAHGVDAPGRCEPALAVARRPGSARRRARSGRRRRAPVRISSSWVSASSIAWASCGDVVGRQRSSPWRTSSPPMRSTGHAARLAVEVGGLGVDQRRAAVPDVPRLRHRPDRGVP